MRGEDLPDRTSGAALFADISGFTPLADALVREFKPGRGAEELTNALNLVYGALIGEVHRHGGSVVGFSGDAITCWFDGDEGQRAAASAAAMQQVMGRFAEVQVGSRVPVTLAIKATVAAGPARRFLVGDPQIQVIDVLAGATLERATEGQDYAEQGEVVVGAEVVPVLRDRVEFLEWRPGGETCAGGGPGRFAVVAGMAGPAEVVPWPDLRPARAGGEGQLAGLGEEQVRPWLLPPIWRRLRLEEGRFLAELRPAVALFLKFGGPDYDWDDAAGEKLDRFVRWVQGVLSRYESYLLQLTCGEKGNYLYAAFGAPLAHDDDPIRAVAAAGELRSPPSDMDDVGDVQIGISQGRMRVGAYGGPLRRTYGVLGDEVNVAARLMMEARPGQILVSQRIAEAAARWYRCEHLGSTQLKGKTAPLALYTVSAGRLPCPQRPAMAFRKPLVGREDELARMEQLLESARAGEGHVLRLVGVAGIGKSHLAAEFVEQASGRGLRVVLGACHSTTQAIAYTPWQQAFRALFDLGEEVVGGEDASSRDAQRIAQVSAAIQRKNPGWLPRLPLLGDLLGLPIPDNQTTAAFDPKLRQESLFALLVEIVQAWAEDQPLLLLVEDVHWMDEASLALTTALSRAVGRLPVLLALVHRPPDAEDEPLLAHLDRLPYCQGIDLGELPPQGIRDLVAHRLGGEPSQLAMALIEKLAQGNPFFAEELVDALREEGGLYPGHDGSWALSESILSALREANCLAREDGQWFLAPQAQVSTVALGIPDSVQGLVLSRIDRLPESHRLTLKVAGVIGRSFEFSLLAGSHPGRLGREELLGQMDLLQAFDFARIETPTPQLTYAFKHNITQEVAYQTLLEEQRRGLHRAVGEALEQLLPGAVERLAYHYSHSGVREKAIQYLDRAARRAQAEYANEIALSYYNQALALEERWEWLKGKAEMLHILGQRDEERAVLEALEKTAAPLADVAYLWGQYEEATGEYSQARASVGRALTACRDRDDKAGEVRCLARLGLIARRQGDYAKAKEWYHEALSVLQDWDAWADGGVEVLNGLGTVHRQQGELEEGRRRYEQALALSRTSGNRMAEAEILSNLGITAFYQRELSAARSLHRQALEIRRAIGDRAGVGISLGNLALTARDMGDYRQVRDFLLEALEIQQAIGNRWDEANVWNDLGIFYLLVGELPEARACFEKSLQLSQEIGDDAGQAYCLGNLALVVREQEDMEEAGRLLKKGLDLAREQGDKHLEALFLSHQGTVHLLKREYGQAIAYADAALATRRGLGLHLWTTADLTTLASAYQSRGEMETALRHVHQVLSILDGCGGEGPEFPQHDYFVCYQVLSSAGEEQAAHRALQSAYDLVMVQADKIADPSLRRSFLERVRFNRQILEAYGREMPGSTSKAV